VTDIFFSYSSADRERVRPVRDALVAQGFEVFWDQEVPTGLDWDSWIRQHLAKCKCAMAFWSAASVASDNVRHEAVVAKQQGKLISVLLENLTAQQFPMGLYAQQAANLADWNGDPNHKEWRKLRREYEAKLIPTWVRQQLDELDAELVGERARREGVERRDKTLQAQIAKEAQAHQDLKRELDKALDDTASLQATIDNLSKARLEAETAARELQRERDEVLGQSHALKATAEELSRIRSENEANIVELSRNLNEKTAQLSALTKSSARQIGLARSAMRAALFARGSTMQCVSIAAAVATLAFWTYHLVGSASPPIAQEQESVQESALLPVAVADEAQRKIEEAEQLRKEAERQANLAADGDSKRKEAEADQQRLAAALKAEQEKQVAPTTTDKSAALSQSASAPSKGLFEIRRGMQARSTSNDWGDFLAVTTSAEECQQRCTPSAKCNAFTFNKADKTCYSFSNAQLVPNTNFDSGVRQSAAPTGTQSASVRDKGRFEIRRDTEATGPYFSSKPAASIVQCEQACIENDKCQIFTYAKPTYTSTPGCFLYDNAKANLIKNDKYDTGIRP
jgi:hypothetical protein